MFGNSKQIRDKPMYKILCGSRKHCGAKCSYALEAIFVFKIFLFLTCSTAGFKCGPGDSRGTTFPSGDIHVKYGDDLKILCLLDTEGESKYNVSNLFFYEIDKIVDPSFTSIINSSTRQLHIQHPSRAESNYSCRLCKNIKNPSTDCRAICHNTVIIDTAPAEAKDFQCVSQNWENLTCTWQIPCNYAVVTHNLTFHLELDPQPYWCPQVTKNKCQGCELCTYSCFWNSSTSTLYRTYYPKYTFNLISTNTFGNSKKQTMQFDHYANVIPSNPVNLSFINVTTHTVTLQWEHLSPMVEFESKAGLEHRLKYRHNYMNETYWKELTLKLKHLNVKGRLIYEYTLNDLEYANTNYSVRVFVRSAKTNREDYWSDFASLSFKTMPEIPSKCPDTFLGGFEFSQYGNIQRRDVIIYWKQLAEYEKNGDNFSYVIMRVVENGISLHIQPDDITNAYARFKNMSQESLTFVVASQNEVGYSKNASYVNVPEFRNDIPKPVFLHKEPSGPGLYNLLWKSPINSLRVESYTIFSCSDEKPEKPSHCEGHLEAQLVSSNTFSLPWNVTNNSKIYQFAISANYGKLSSGMLWATCTLGKNEVKSMQDVSIETVGSTFIVMRWNSACYAKMENIKRFRLYYCQVKNESTNKHCPKEESITIDGDGSLKRGTITGLNPVSSYIMRVAIINTTDGEGPLSEYVFNTTLEGAPTPPQNPRITQVTNKTISMAWDPPKSSNGVLQKYKVLCNQSPHTIVEKISNNSIQTETVLRDITSYTDYIISVVACTKEACSNESKTVFVHTAIGPPGDIVVKDNNYTSNAIILSWHPPKPAGANISRYEIRVVMNSSEGSNILKTYMTKDTKLEPIDMACNENPLYYIRAINYDDEPYHGVKIISNNTHVILDENSHPQVNATYYGAWSEFKNNYPPLNCNNTVWILGVMIPIFIVVLAIALKKYWDKVMNMKKVPIIMPPGLLIESKKKLDTHNSAAEPFLKDSKLSSDKTNTDISVSSENTNSTTVSDSSQKESSELVTVVPSESTHKLSPILSKMNNQNRELIRKDDLQNNLHNDIVKTIHDSMNSCVIAHDTSTKPDKEPYVTMPSNSVNAPRYVTVMTKDFLPERTEKPNFPMSSVLTAPNNFVMQAIATPDTSTLMKPEASTSPQFSFSSKGYVGLENIPSMNKLALPKMVAVFPDKNTGHTSHVPFTTSRGSVLDETLCKNIPSPNMDHVMVANSQMIPSSRSATPVSLTAEKSLEIVRNPTSGYVSVQDATPLRLQKPMKTEVTLSPQAYSRYSCSAEPNQKADSKSLLHDITQSDSKIMKENKSS